jgi:phosphoribosylformimino-5-aminoimidazole carboxamide ribotide isomerase
MIVYPAIDLYEHKVVRLTKGDFSHRNEYGDDPVGTAASFAKAGATWLHVVDLEGARRGTPVHLDLLPTLAELGLSVQYGGGLRRPEDITATLDAGAARAMVGSLLAKDEKTARRCREEFGNRVLPTVDVRGDHVAVSGWTRASTLTPELLLRRLLDLGYEEFLVTAVDRDGTGEGPDIPLYQRLLRLCPEARLIAAGGIWSERHVHLLEEAGLTGAVVGKALYEGAFDLAAALRRWHLC